MEARRASFADMIPDKELDLPLQRKQHPHSARTLTGCKSWPTVCNECGETFERMSGEWAWKAWTRRKNGGKGPVWFCSYTCMRKDERRREEAEKAKQARKEEIRSRGGQLGAKRGKYKPRHTPEEQMEIYMTRIDENVRLLAKATDRWERKRIQARIRNARAKIRGMGL